MIPVRVGDIEVLVETSSVAGTQQTSSGRAAERATAHVTGAFERAQEALEEIALSTARTVGRITRRVGAHDQLEVEFGIKLSAKGDVIVAGAGAEALLKVKITYSGTRLPTPRIDDAGTSADPETEDSETSSA